MNLLTIILIAVSLSIDAFSLALSYGTIFSSKKDYFVLSIFVGLFHFIMPFLGYNTIGLALNNIIVNSNKLLVIIFSFIAIEMIIDIIKKDKVKFNMSLKSKLLFAFSVSLDSFSIGIGLARLTTIPYISMLIFTFISFLFTYLGLIIGNYSYQKIGIYAKLMGLLFIIILIIKNIIID